MSTLAQAALHGVVPVHRAAFTGLHHNALRWSNRLKQAFAVCHSLNAVSKTAVAGLDIERSLFKTVEARFLVRQLLVPLTVTVHMNTHVLDFLHVGSAKDMDVCVHISQ